MNIISSLLWVEELRRIAGVSLSAFSAVINNYVVVCLTFGELKPPNC
jgi:hypothetical protein